jgi:cytosine/adenosine deaminase-related metal-dependent hydrolase
VNERREIIIDGAILVENNRINAISTTDSILQQYNSQEINTIDLEHKIVIPGLINTHAHVAQSLLRGLAEDLPLHSWLCDAIWPLEACFEGDDGYVAARLTIAEMLKSGTTCFLEAMCTHRANIENVVRAVEESGIRACLVSLIPLTLYAL